jgi:hypothetical protein
MENKGMYNARVIISLPILHLIYYLIYYLVYHYQ